MRGQLEDLASRLPGNVIIFRAPSDWRPRAVRHALVPIGGRVVHNALRARLLNGLQRRVDEELVVRGLNKPDPKRRVFGRLTTRLVQGMSGAVVGIGQRS